jgi:hypothetical protein
VQKVLVLQNEHRRELLPVLDRLGALRRGYGALRRGDIAPAEDPLRHVLAALRDPRVEIVLNPLLARESLAPPRRIAQGDVIEREKKLAPLFGFSEREAGRYISDASAAQSTTGSGLAIGTATELDRLLIDNHQRASEAAASVRELSFLRRRQPGRLAERTALVCVFMAGLIVADGLYRELFAHSYAFAVLQPVPTRP